MGHETRDILADMIICICEIRDALGEHNNHMRELIKALGPPSPIVVGKLKPGELDEAMKSAGAIVVTEDKDGEA